MRFLFDTSILIDHLRGQDTHIIGHYKKQGDIFISVVTDFEIWRGARPPEEEETTILLNIIPSLDITKSIAKAAAGIYQQQAKTFGLELPDCLILATADQHHLRLITKDRNLDKAAIKLLPAS